MYSIVPVTLLLVLFTTAQLDCASALPFSVALRASTARAFVTGPGVCRFNIDCPPHKFCNSTDSLTPALCTPHPPLGANCATPRTGIVVCKYGHYCDPTVDKDGRPLNKCRRQATLNEPCSGGARSCQRQLVCDGGKCRPPRRTGKIGASCAADRDCNPWLQCSSSKCEMRARVGERCEFANLPSNCVRGAFCRAVPDPRFVVNRCERQTPLGAACTADVQCLGSTLANPQPRRPDHVVCTGRGGAVGVCARYTAVLKRLGAVCNRDHDLCDRSRGLSCQWAKRKRKHVCQQLHDADSDPRFAFCTPGADLSACRASESVCRFERALPVPGYESRQPFAMCLRKVRHVPPGRRCDFERARCTQGSSCTVAERVSRGSPVGPDPPPLPLYCMFVRGVGGWCGFNRFRAKCADGLVCRKNRCTKGPPGSGDPVAPNDFVSGLGGVCSSRMFCAPHLECMESGVARTLKICQKPIALLKQGMRCDADEFVNRQCPVGVPCRLSATGPPWPRCLPTPNRESTARRTGTAPSRFTARTSS